MVPWSILMVKFSLLNAMWYDVSLPYKDMTNPYIEVEHQNKARIEC